MTAVACTVLAGRPVAVTGSYDRTVRVWNAVTAVACTLLNGRPVAVTGSDDQTVRVWDLTTGAPVGIPQSLPESPAALDVLGTGLLLVGFGWDVALLRTPLSQQIGTTA